PAAGDFKIGDAVFGDISGHGWGGFAEYVCVPESVLAPISPGMSFIQAASVPQAGLMALAGLRDVKAGQVVLLNGAGGGVGTIGIQLAKSSGAEVIAVDSALKQQAMLDLGADRVIDYTETDFTQTGDRYDLILDVVANRSIRDYQRALTPHGTFSMIGGSTRTILRVLGFGSIASRRSSKSIGIVPLLPNRKDLLELNSHFESGSFAPVIDSVFPLNDTRDAFARFGTAGHFGKIVIRIGDEE
ncbi:MAG: NAD(P)-dependent alcohol dehydrogenase, partial [Anaerolineales bacterium]|nr:NAD(P)-dependent alcohol dehydrogenase [Anaerolineales bacterium]